MPMELLHALVVREDRPDGEATLGGLLGVQIGSDELCMLVFAMREGIDAHKGRDAEMDRFAQELFDSMLVIALRTGILTEADLTTT